MLVRRDLNKLFHTRDSELVHGDILCHISYCVYKSIPKCWLEAPHGVLGFTFLGDVFTFNQYEIWGPRWDGLVLGGGDIIHAFLGS